MDCQTFKVKEKAVRVLVKEAEEQSENFELKNSERKRAQ